ncbi:hypothetical protein HID58_022948 [Brassica napus]|uniref:Bromo domain-containing protein n=1 Tax=Brassica napus TaxID=3708 RepID=A0ABQ8D319_BRANA|nr:hypothetical protein HID58_022948 [Brassica napus]
MDLGTIRSRLREGEYSSPLEFAADVHLTFSNSMAYNPPGNQYHKMARDLSTYFESRWKIIERKILVVEPPVMSLTSSASLEFEVPFEIEIEIDTLSDETLFMVRKFLDEYLRDKKKSQEKSEPCEMEIVHDSGFSNSPLQPSKCHLLIDEDVYIVGGNDPLVSRHPPFKIEKDIACRNSSSSSSSESGS